jgi:hypothetical protein
VHPVLDTLVHELYAYVEESGHSRIHRLGCILTRVATQTLYIAALWSANESSRVSIVRQLVAKADGMGFNHL